MREDFDGPKKAEKKVFKRLINWWYGQRKEGEWIREVTTTGVSRTYTNVARDEDGNLILFEELISIHQCYRPKFEGEKNTRKATFFRGARVWMDR